MQKKIVEIFEFKRYKHYKKCFFNNLQLQLPKTPEKGQKTLEQK